ncbi:MAG: hypothetical protein R2716_03090 [Microthrixaceae bacterium]
MSATETGDGAHEARIEITEAGVVHVTAQDWASLGFGQGWGCCARQPGGDRGPDREGAWRALVALGPGPEDSTWGRTSATERST